MTYRDLIYNQKKLRLSVRDDVDDSVIGEIFNWHEYRSAEDAIRSATDPIVDLGAHAGFFTLYCRSLNETVPIISVEPSPDNITQLQWHIAKNSLQNIQIAPFAIATKTGSRDFYLAPDSHNHRLGLPPDKKSGTSIKVPSYSWADFCSRYKLPVISLLKIDIEGGERELFTSLKPDALSGVKNIILEYHNTTDKLSAIIEQILREHGFSVSHFPSRFDKQYGFLFARNKRH